jgi:hypothetical protein
MGLVKFIINALWPSQPPPLPTISPLTSITSSTITKSKPRQMTCRPRSRSPKHTTRTIIFTDCITLLGYPSRGGLIVLERADAVDFNFLNLSRLSPPLTRATDPKAEDEFCQRLLLLGAKWFDSESRYRFMAGVREDEYRAILDLESGEKPELTLGERRWVGIGWPSEPTRGLWVGEWDTNWPGILEEERQVPTDAARLTLATNMDERCEILKGMGARFYESLDEYEGGAYLRAWQTKWVGEVEPLEQTWRKD